MLFVVTNGQEAAVYSWVQGFDASIHDLREAGNLRDANDRNAFLRQKCAGAACGDNFYA